MHACSLAKNENALSIATLKAQLRFQLMVTDGNDKNVAAKVLELTCQCHSIHISSGDQTFRLAWALSLAAVGPGLCHPNQS